LSSINLLEANPSSPIHLIQSRPFPGHLNTYTFISNCGPPIGVQMGQRISRNRKIIAFAELIEREFGGFTPPKLCLSPLARARWRRNALPKARRRIRPRLRRKRARWGTAIQYRRSQSRPSCGPNMVRHWQRHRSNGSPIARARDRAGQSGLVLRYYLRPDDQGLPLPRGDHGLGQPRGAGRDEYRTHSAPIFASRHSMKRSHAMAGRRFSIPIRAASSPVTTSPAL